MKFLYRNIITFVLILFLIIIGYNTNAQLSKSDNEILERYLTSAKKFAKNDETENAANYY